ncbi:BON domain-containing protein [Novosphingobium sp. 9]|uniref:BON domain-containing protein n=1 Tax=Novosphingobium sp. 9 TaxID=2025349 RepID=UPI0021B58EE8|nr:BON domain-containing protein [Novosphingobium sp. 9]
MNRRDIDSRFGSHQSYAGSSGNQSEGYESPRQANQLHSGGERQAGERQAGGGWGQGSASPDLPPSRETRSESPTNPRDGEYRLIREESHRDRWSEPENTASRRDPVYPMRNYDAAFGNEFRDFTSEDYGGRDFYASRRPVGGASPSYSYRPTYGPDYGGGLMRSEYYGSARDDNDEGYGSWRRYGEQRGFFERAGDEIASWFGDRDAAARRQQDHRSDQSADQSINHRGRGPSDYTRSDERIREDANDALTHDWMLDASNITLTVAEGEVTLSGTVESRHAKRRAEDVIDNVSGVKHVQNNLRVATGGTGGTAGA